MNHKRMTADEAIEYILEADDSLDSFCRFAFRGDDFIPVKKFRKSHYHGDEQESYRLDGVSACEIRYADRDEIVQAMCDARQYGSNVFLLLGESLGGGDDSHSNEVVLGNHKIIAIVDAEFVKDDWDWTIR